MQIEIMAVICYTIAAFHNFLDEQGVPHIYEEAAGSHDMVFRNKYVEKFIPVIFGE